MRKLLLLVWVLGITATGAAQPVDTLRLDSILIQLDSLRGKIDTFIQESLYDLPLDALDSLSILDPSSAIDAMINSQVSVASGVALSARNSPGVITVISEDEIRNSGARDLIDVLRMVPGLAFALDEEGRVGIGMRGNWANEGKVLLVIDGQEMNDIYSAGLSFGNHYPVEMIKRIEIIRGPGSALYGGFAGLGVIKITTYNGDDVSGISAGLQRGNMQGDASHRNRRFYFGKNWENLTFNISVFQGQGNRSDQDAFGFFPRDLRPIAGAVGATASLADNARINPGITNIHAQWKGFSFRSIVDFYDITDVSYLDTSLTRPVRRGIRNAYNAFSYKWDPSDKYELDLTYHTVLQFPRFAGLPDSVLAGQEENRVNRNRFRAINTWRPTHRIQLQAGGEFFRDFASANLNRELQPVGREDVSYTNLAFFAQGIFRLPQAYITTGVRYDYNSNFGQAWVPRLALTRKRERYHFKLMASGAFRAPSIGNFAQSFTGTYGFSADSTNILIGSNRGLSPERTLILEAEAGFRPARNWYLTVNAFDMTISDPIVYSFYQDSTLRANFGESAGFRAYQNGSGGGTRGWEADLRYRHENGYLKIGYAHYGLANKERIFAHSVTNFAFNPDQRTIVDNDQVLAFARHRFNMHGTLMLTSKLSINVTGSYFSKRYGFDRMEDPATGMRITGELKELPPLWLLNTFVRYQGLLLKGLDFGLGVYDVLGQQMTYYQPYFGLDAPLPGPSRTILGSLSLDLSFSDRKKRKKADF
ncbi:MAG: TonB-dependent receptor plug domain-containing protein [Bacteroidota bacterium]